MEFLIASSSTRPPCWKPSSRSPTPGHDRIPLDTVLLQQHRHDMGGIPIRVRIWNGYQLLLFATRRYAPIRFFEGHSPASSSAFTLTTDEMKALWGGGNVPRLCGIHVCYRCSRRITRIRAVWIGLLCGQTPMLIGSAVPEPASFGLVGLDLVSIGFRYVNMPPRESPSLRPTSDRNSPVQFDCRRLVELPFLQLS